mmetsp:Transcript_3200/g.5887  ORF Transcript_3200/g.5887 Transcript_3200/m.5887 type:complete len:90 (+) Transcript_3200:845-1114(+)
MVLLAFKSIPEVSKAQCGHALIIDCIPTLKSLEQNSQKEKFYFCTSPSFLKARAEWWSKLWQVFPIQVCSVLFQSLPKVCLAQWSQGNL